MLSEYQLYELLDELVEPDDCRYDHHGKCQSHNLHSAPCPHERAKAAMDDFRRRQKVYEAIHRSRASLERLADMFSASGDMRLDHGVVRSIWLTLEGVLNDAGIPRPVTTAGL